MNYKHQFFNDYAETAHPACIHKLLENALQQEAGYGLDSVSAHAAVLIRQKLGVADEIPVHFISGGTQANITVLGSLLRPHEAVIAAESGHIAANETGAIEATGHKVIHTPHSNGKLTPEGIEQVMRAHLNEHSVKPRMVFISQATELGTVYSRSELEVVRAVCNAHDLWLYIDGARIGNALYSENAQCEWHDIARMADVFYIGGTKNGALLGEAIVFPNSALNDDFRYALKQRGALLAKGRVIASQFVVLFESELYAELAKHANDCAMRLRAGLSELGVMFYTDSATNQQFPILPNEVINTLQQDYGFYTWKSLNECESVVRFVFSWATPMVMVDELLTDARRLLNP